MAQGRESPGFPKIAAANLGLIRDVSLHEQIVKGYLEVFIVEAIHRRRLFDNKVVGFTAMSWLGVDADPQTGPGLCGVCASPKQAL